MPNVKTTLSLALAGILCIGALAAVSVAYADEEKVTTPTVEKYIGEVEGTDNLVWAKRADAQIGAAIPYKAVGTLPETYDMAEKYSYTFVDRHPANLVIDESSIVLYLADKSGNVQSVIKGGYEVSTTNSTLEVRFDNLKDAVDATSANNTIMLTYEAKLTDNTDFGVAGATDNSVVIRYDDGTHNGESVPSVAQAITYRLIIVKTDGTNPLDGAQFAITGGFGTFATEGGSAQVPGLDATDYTIIESKAPEGYVGLTDSIKLNIKSNVTEDKPLTLSAEVENAELISVDARYGTITIEVENPKDTSGDADKDDEGTDSNNGGNTFANDDTTGTSSNATPKTYTPNADDYNNPIKSALAKTGLNGDLWPLVIIAPLAVVIATIVILRRTRRKSNS